jgi:hypothetical protein
MPVPENAEFFLLPFPAEISFPPLGLRSAIESRRSIRNYAKELSRLKSALICVGAHRELLSGMNRTLLFVMFLRLGDGMLSETYLHINRVKGLEPGLYRYLAI